MRRPSEGLIVALGQRWPVFVLGSVAWGLLGAGQCVPGAPLRIDRPTVPMPLHNTPATPPPSASATPTPTPSVPTPSPAEVAEPAPPP